MTARDVFARCRRLLLMSGTMRRTAPEIAESFTVRGTVAGVQDFGRSTLAPLDGEGRAERVFLTTAGKLRDALELVRDLNDRGRPVLMVSQHGDLARKFALMLAKAGILDTARDNHNLVDPQWYGEFRDNNAAQEALLKIKDQAGTLGAITVGTGMLRRGFDIGVGPEADQVGHQRFTDFASGRVREPRPRRRRRRLRGLPVP